MKHALILLLILLAGCGDEPLIPENAVPFDPPEYYEIWWYQVENRVGLGRPERDVRWFLVPGGLFESREEGANSAGRWVPDGRIYIAEGWQTSDRTVKHEMLHEILQGDTEHRHPAFQYYTDCVGSDGLPTPCVPDF